MSSNEATSRDKAILSVMEEREAQDRQWGGTDHDDEHHPDEWHSFIKKQLDLCDGNQGLANYRERLVKIAALAVAAIESFDRLSGVAGQADR